MVAPHVEILLYVTEQIFTKGLLIREAVGIDFMLL